MDFDKPKVYGDTFISDGLVYFIRDKDEKINKYTVLSVLSPTTAIPIGLKCHKATLYNRLMMMSDELYVET